VIKYDEVLVCYYAFFDAQLFHANKSTFVLA